MEYEFSTQIELADAVLAEFGKKDRPEIHRQGSASALAELGIDPRGIDREIVEALHRTHMGVDNDWTANIILHGLRTAIADGWGGSMIATELQDVMLGTPSPLRTEANFLELQSRRGECHSPWPRAPSL